MNLLIEGVATGDVQRTDRKEKHSIDGVTRVFDVYKIKSDLLYYNDQNDRIATWVSEYESSHGSDLSLMARDEFNRVIEGFVVESNEAALKKTQRDIAKRGQLRAGLVLNDGRVIDGNRRLTCIRRNARERAVPGWFEAVILDGATASDPKRIKLLELAIQIGEEERVSYDPVDRLVGVYRDLVRDRLITPAEYGRATGLSKGEVNKLIDRARYMEEFLEFCQAPEQYHLARALKVDGPLGEFSRVLKKWGNRRDRELAKRLMFADIVVQPEGDITRHIRSYGKVAGSEVGQDLLGYGRELMPEILDKMGSGPLTVGKVSELRADEELTRKFHGLRMVMEVTGNHIEEREAPAKRAKAILSSLEKIDPKIFAVLDHQELEALHDTFCDIYIKTADLIRKVEWAEVENDERDE